MEQTIQEKEKIRIFTVGDEYLQSDSDNWQQKIVEISNVDLSDSILGRRLKEMHIIPISKCKIIGRDKFEIDNWILDLNPWEQLRMNYCCPLCGTKIGTGRTKYDGIWLRRYDTVANIGVIIKRRLEHDRACAKRSKIARFFLRGT